MYAVRTLPLAAPLAAGLWADGTAGAVLLSVVAALALLLVGRHAHLHLRAARDTGPARRHRADER